MVARHSELGIQVEQMMTYHGALFAIYNHGQEHVEPASADQDLIETISTIAINVVNLVEAR